MKNSTIIKCFITFFVVASIALLIINQHKDKLFSYHNTVGVNIVYMIQDPESGEYQRSEQEDFKVEKNQAYTYEPREIENYDVNLEKSYLSSESVAEPTEFTVYYDCELCTVTFTSTEGELVSGSETQTVRKGQTISSYPEYEKQGYDHVGFLPDVKKIYLINA